MSEARFRSPLSAEAMRQVMHEVMTGKMSDEDIGNFLSTLAQRKETAEEIAIAVEVLRTHAVSVPLSRSYELCDTCGTGGDGKGTVNVSTLASIITAACGVRVAKHGNRAASSRCGSADVLEALGVNLAATPEQVAKCIEEIGFGFCFAPLFHPAMKAVASVRKNLGIRTIFNLVGPLANPAPLTFQLVGVSDGHMLRPMAEALARLSITHGMVVHGSDGLDEITTTGPTRAIEVRNGSLTELVLDAAVLGIPRAELEELKGAEVPHNADLATAILDGVHSPLRDIVVLNAGAALYIADKAETIGKGIAAASEAIDSGKAKDLLERFRAMTHAG